MPPCNKAGIYNELNWPTLADRRKGIKLKNFLKIINSETPEFLHSLLPKRIGDVRPQSRNPDNYYTVKARRKHSGLVLFLPQLHYGIPVMSVTEL